MSSNIPFLMGTTQVSSVSISILLLSQLLTRSRKRVMLFPITTLDHWHDNNEQSSTWKTKKGWELIRPTKKRRICSQPVKSGCKKRLWWHFNTTIFNSSRLARNGSIFWGLIFHRDCSYSIKYIAAVVVSKPSVRLSSNAWHSRSFLRF